MYNNARKPQIGADQTLTKTIKCGRFNDTIKFYNKAISNAIDDMQRGFATKNSALCTLEILIASMHRNRKYDNRQLLYLVKELCDTVGRIIIDLKLPIIEPCATNWRHFFVNQIVERVKQIPIEGDASKKERKFVLQQLNAELRHKRDTNNKPAQLVLHL